MPFTNVQLDPNELPHIEDINYIPLNKGYKKVAIIGTTIFWVVVGLALGAGAINPKILTILTSNLLLMLGAGFLVCLIMLSYFLAIRGFSQKGFAIREKDISYKSGIFWKTVVNIPFNRVQHAEVKQGPLERFYNIAQLRIFTAGGSSSDLRIPGLLPDQADSLKRMIVNKVSKGSDEQE